ncbi:MAG: sigma-70 family RNA polymerase sigma factor [Enhygromyxa sp.]
MSAFEQDCDFDAGDSGTVDGPWDEADALEPAFESFYREHYAFVWRSARRMLAGADDARLEDLIQDTWITVYRRFESFNGECRPTTWLFGILRNVARNHDRSERRRLRRLTAFAAHERDRSSNLADASLALARPLLDGFLETLDEDKRAVFVLAELEGQSGREIAAALGINPNTAASRLRAARRQFCAYFELPPSRRELTAELRALREQPEQPPAQACARSRALLIAGLGEGTLAATGGTVGLAVLGQGLLGKLAAVAAALLVVGVGVNASVDDSEPVTAAAGRLASSAEPSRAFEPPLPSSASVEALAPEPSEALEAEPIPVLAPGPAPAPAPPVKPAVDAHELLRRARGALVADQPAQALELLARIPRSSSTLRGERAATEIAALCRLERGSQARTVAEALAAVEPNSPLLARVDSACW